MADFGKLASYIAGLKVEIKKAEKKAEFFKSQYEKYREQTPDMGASHKLLMRFEVDKIHLLKGQIKKAEEHLRRVHTLKANRPK